MRNNLTQRQFYSVMWRVLAKDKQAELKVVREGEYFNVKVFYEGGSQYLAGPDYTFNGAFAEEKRQKYLFMMRGML